MIMIVIRSFNLIAAYFLLVITSIGASEAAEETVQNLAGISESLVEKHEEFALTALVGLKCIVDITTRKIMTQIHV
jgi:hypothetical protein